MENTGVQGGCAPSENARLRWPRAQRRSLLIAFALSLVAHLLVLSSLHAPRVGDARTPVLVVTLARPIAASPKPTPHDTPGAPAAPAVRPSQQQRAKEGALAPAAKGAQVQAADAPRPRASSVATPRSLSAEQEQAFVAADTLDLPPNPLSSPELGDVGHRIEGRRLQASVWVDEDGVVRKAFVKRNEISEDVAVLLEHAIANVHFAPGRKDGRPVPAVLDARLCFDEAGVLDTHSEDCLRPAAGPEQEPNAR